MVSACGEPVGALIAFVIFRVAGFGSSLTPVPATVKPEIAWRSVEPPVPPEKPTYAEAGSATARLPILAPSIHTAIPPSTVSILILCVPVRSDDGRGEKVVSQCSVPAVVPAPSLMPMKLLEGLTEFCQVSNATAKPEVPAKPSPPPCSPSAVGADLVASAITKARPSAPLPPPIESVNS